MAERAGQRLNREMTGRIQEEVQKNGGSEIAAYLYAVFMTNDKARKEA